MLFIIVFLFALRRINLGTNSIDDKSKLLTCDICTSPIPPNDVMKRAFESSKTAIPFISNDQTMDLSKITSCMRQ